MPVIGIKIVAGIHPEQELYKTFDDRGGVIGRAEECDWVLRDLTRVVSKQHAVISYEQGQFWLEDISTNGILVGTELAPLGRGNRRCLLSKDQFKIGDFVFQTEQSEENAANLLDVTQGHSSSELLAILNNTSSEQGQFEVDNSPAPVHQVFEFDADEFKGAFGLSDEINSGSVNPPFRSSPQPQVNALPDDWELSGFFNAAPLSAIEIQKSPASLNDGNALDLRSLHEPDSLAITDDLIPDLPAIDELEIPPVFNNQEMAAEPQITPPVIPVAHVRNQEKNESDSSKKIYEALGLPPELYGRVSSGNFDTEIADIVHKTTSGLMNLLQARAQFKHDTRMSLTQVSARSNNPLKFCIEAGDALELMLVKKKPGYLTASEAFEEAIQDLKTHQAAFICGLQAALTGVLAELAPERIEQELKSGMLGKVEMVAHAQAWKLYKDRQHELNQAVIHNFSEVMGKYFSDAYSRFVAESKLDEE